MRGRTQACGDGLSYNDSMENIQQNQEYHQDAHVRTRPGDSPAEFFKRTVAAQMHAVASVLSVITSIILLRLASTDQIENYIATAVFCVTAILLFAASAVQHFLDDGFHISRRLLLHLENADKFAVYLLIAGTYTAVLTYTLSGPSRAWLLGLVWFLAISGCLYTIFIERLPKWAQSRVFYTGQFVLLGWTVLLRIQEVAQGLSDFQLIAFFCGGGSYTLGAIAYALKRPNLSKYFGYHELWHLSVMVGCFMFFVVVGSFYF